MKREKPKRGRPHLYWRDKSDADRGLRIIYPDGYVEYMHRTDVQFYKSCFYIQGDSQEISTARAETWSEAAYGRKPEFICNL